MPEEKAPLSKRDKSYRNVTEHIHDRFIGYCNHNRLNTGDTLSKAMEEYMKKHPSKK